MPESYPSIGEAVGAAMQHNIRLARGKAASGSEKPLQVRYLPHTAADPYSVPGMIARVTETATPEEVAGIVEEVNGALVGVLPQLTELVAAAADWTQALLAFDDPHHRPRAAKDVRGHGSATAAASVLGRHAEEAAAAGDGTGALRALDQACFAYDFADHTKEQAWVRFVTPYRTDSLALSGKIDVLIGASM